MADRYGEPQNGARPLDERGGAVVVSVGGYVEGRTKGIPGAFVVFVSRVNLEGSPIRLSPHMARTMRLPIILHTGNTQALRAVGKVVSLYHRLMLSHTCFLTLFCGRLGQCSLYTGGTSLEHELDWLKGEIMLQHAAGKDEAKKLPSQVLPWRAGGGQKPESCGRP